MFQLIKNFFSPRQVLGDKKKKEGRVKKSDFLKGFDAAKQLKEMGKLGGKLILM